jgi:hypothetical protein
MLLKIASKSIRLSLPYLQLKLDGENLNVSRESFGVVKRADGSTTNFDHCKSNIDQKPLKQTLNDKEAECGAVG